jgi:hypothetical protein
LSQSANLCFGSSECRSEFLQHPTPIPSSIQELRPFEPASAALPSILLASSAHLVFPSRLVRAVLGVHLKCASTTAHSEQATIDLQLFLPHSTIDKQQALALQLKMAEDLYSLDSASLSHLSSQLQSLGYISRPLDLPQLFAATPASTSHLSSPSAILAHHAQLANEARAREQVVRCLWSMLGARMDASEGLEALAARERVGNYELERVKGMLSKEKKAREAAEKEREKETAKAK